MIDQKQLQISYKFLTPYKTKSLHFCKPMFLWCRLPDSNWRPTAYKGIGHAIF